jgi:hypothetical protein
VPRSDAQPVKSVLIEWVEDLSAPNLKFGHATGNHFVAQLQE